MLNPSLLLIPVIVKSNLSLFMYMKVLLTKRHVILKKHEETTLPHGFIFVFLCLSLKKIVKSVGFEKKDIRGGGNMAELSMEGSSNLHRHEYKPMKTRVIF